MEVIKLRISRVKEPIIKETKAKPKILAEKDIYINSIAGQIV